MKAMKKIYLILIFNLFLLKREWVSGLVEMCPAGRRGRAASAGLGAGNMCVTWEEHVVLLLQPGLQLVHHFILVMV